MEGEYALDTLLVLWRNDLRLVRPLEPSQILLVESPSSFLELFCCQILLIRPNLVVKDVEQRIRVEAAKHGWLIENGSRLLWVVMRRWIRLFWDVVLWPVDRQGQSANRKQERLGHFTFPHQKLVARSSNRFRESG